MPEVLPLRKVLGPGVIAAGIGLASGEFILWPYITSQVGLVFLWAAILGVVTQFFINMEIERYTLATGETALTGFSRYWRHWGLFFAVLTFLANAWPGWITSSATLVTFIFGGGNVKLLAILGLASIAIALTMAPVVYTVVERVEFFKVGIILFFLVVAIATAITADAWSSLPDAVTGFGRLPEGLPLALVLPALAFAGAGGGQNLVQSNWMRDKGYGMGVHIPRLASPVTGAPEAAPGTGYTFREDEENLARWKGWWEVANKEQLVSFVAITIVTIVLMSLLAYATVFGIEGDNNISFLEAEGNALMDTVGHLVRLPVLDHRGDLAVRGRAGHRRLHLPAGRRRAQGQLPARQRDLVREPHLLPPGLAAGGLEHDHPADHPVPAADPADHLRLHRRVHDVHLLGPAHPDQQAVAAAVGPDQPLPDGDDDLVGAAVRDRLG